MSNIYNSSNYNQTGDFVELPYLQRRYATKSLLSASLAPLVSGLTILDETSADHEDRIVVLEGLGGSGSGSGTSLSSDANFNTVAGSLAGDSITSGANNTVFGYNAGTAINSGANNTLCGYGAGPAITSGGQNVLLGFQAGFAINSGFGNVVIGHNAGTSITTGSSNICIGLGANNAGVGSNNCALGVNISSALSNEYIIGNNQVTVIRNDGNAICDLGSSTKNFKTIHSRNINIYGTGSLASYLIMNQGSNNGSVFIKAPDSGIISSYVITLPTAAPTSNGQVLSATTAGVMSWVSASGGTVESDLTTLTGRVTATEGVNTTQTTDITSLTTRMTAAEGMNTAQNMNMTSLNQFFTTKILAVEGVNTTQTTNIADHEDRLSVLEAGGGVVDLDLTSLTGRVTATENVNATQTADILNLDDRVTSVESTNTAQTTNINALVTRMTAAEGVNTTQNTNFSALDSRVTGAEIVNTTQTTNITGLTTRMTAAEGVNTTQNTNITALDTRVTAAEGVNTTQTTNITALDTRVTAAEGVNTTQNTRLTAIEGLNTLQQTNISDHETRLSTIEVGGGVVDLTDLTARVTAIEGVNTTQNTNITAVDTRVTSVASVNTTQQASINSLGTRVTTVEGVIMTQNTNITNLTTRMSTAENLNTTQTTNITALTGRVGTAETALTNTITKGGNTVTSSLSIGTLNEHDVVFKQNNTDAITIAPDVISIDRELAVNSSLLVAGSLNTPQLSIGAYGFVEFVDVSGNNSIAIRQPDTFTPYQIVLPTGPPASAGQVLSADTDGSTSWITPTGGSSVGDIVNGGQNGVVSIGSLDASSLSFKTNNLPRMTVNSTTGAINCIYDTNVSGAFSTVGTATIGTNLFMNGNADHKSGNASRYFQSDNTQSISIRAPFMGVTSYSITLPASAPTKNGQVLSMTQAGNTSWANALITGGNAIGSAISLGTNDAYGVSFRSNNVTAMSLTDLAITLLKPTTCSSSLTVAGVTSLSDTAATNIVCTGDVEATGALICKGTGASSYQPGKIVLYTGPNTFTTTINGPSTASNLSFTWPNNVGSNNWVLKTDGTGAMNWADPTSLSTNTWTNGLRAFGGDATIGIVDNYLLRIVQNGTNKLVIADTYVNCNVPLTVLGNLIATGNLSTSGILSVTGNSSLSGNLSVTGTFNVNSTAVFQTVQALFDITSSSNLNGIGLVLGGSTAIKATGSTFSNPSDIRVKTQIIDVQTETALESINNIQIKKYKYSEDYQTKYNTGDRFYTGVIAGEIEQVFPDCVETKAEFELNGTTFTDFKSVNMSEVYYNLIAATQELSKQVVDLKARIVALENV